MKRYILFLLLIFGAFSAKAQFVGDVAVTRKVLCERNGKLCLVLDVKVGRKAVAPSQSWTIIPELSTADRTSVKIFPHIQINGRHQRQQIERRERLSGRYWAQRKPWKTIEIDGKTDEHFLYEMEVPYEPWMDGATLVLRQILTSADNSRRVFTVDVNGAVDHR